MEPFDRFVKENFLYPRANYHGNFTPENLVFNANLQEFSQKVALIAGLHTNGKLSTDEAYERINRLWRALTTSQKNLLTNSIGGSGEEN
jgi:sigma54-dependent transcription regulator